MEKTRNGKFMRYGILLCVLGVIFMFVYSGLQSDQINIIQTFITEENGGWTTTQTQLPMTVGNFMCIILTFVYGSLFMKFGVKKPLIVIMIITAAGVLGIAASNGLDVNGGSASGNYALYFVSMFIVRCGCMILQMAGFTKIITNRFGGDYRPFYIGIAVLILVICLIVAFGITDTPEEAGFFPDGADHKPKSEEDGEEVKLTVGQVLKEKRAWQLIICFGAYYFTIAACMGSMAVYYMSLGGLRCGSQRPHGWRSAQSLEFRCPMCLASWMIRSVL